MQPDYMVMGMSAETFWDGVEGNRQFVKQIQELTGGLGVATGAEGCERALKLFGAKKIAVVTPYTPIGDANVRKFFTGSGSRSARSGLCVQQRGRDRAGHRADAARVADRDQRLRRRRDRPVRHQPLHDRARRRGRALARQAGDRRSTPRPGGWRCARTASRTSCTATARCSATTDRRSRLLTCTSRSGACSPGRPG